jgi:hypothetical protein
LHSDKFPKIFGFEGWRIFGFFDIFVENFFKEGNETFFHLLDGKARTENGIDPVGAVLSFIKFDEIISDFWVGKSFIVTDGKPAVRSLGKISQDFPFPAVVIIGP